VAGKGKVLVVDDDGPLVKMLNVRLAAEGFDTLLAMDGETAIRLAGEAAPDLILLDIAMPGVNGVDVIERLRDGGDSAIPVVIMTAYPHMIDMVDGYDCVKECFTKPFELPDLMASISRVICSDNGGQTP
jgi:DNA-binding response OmpR family regulator